MILPEPESDADRAARAERVRRAVARASGLAAEMFREIRLRVPEALLRVRNGERGVFVYSRVVVEKPVGAALESFLVEPSVSAGDLVRKVCRRELANGYDEVVLSYAVEVPK